jgi:hypothetical protein
MTANDDLPLQKYHVKFLLPHTVEVEARQIADVAKVAEESLKTLPQGTVLRSIERVPKA